MTVKAHAHRSASLHLSPHALDFGPLALSAAVPPPRVQHGAGGTRRLTIVNVAKGARTCSVSVAPELLLLEGGAAAPLSLRASFRRERATAAGAEALVTREREREELVEVCERKLRIAERKKRPDKAAKWRRKLESLLSFDPNRSQPGSEWDESDASDWAPPPSRSL